MTAKSAEAEFPVGRADFPGQPIRLRFEPSEIENRYTVRRHADLQEPSSDLTVSAN